MGNIYIFRGKAATGKTTLSNMLARKLFIPVLCKDDVVDALKMTETTDKNLVNNRVCYNILYKIIQTNLDLGVDIILDIALGDRQSFKTFSERLDYKSNKVINFFVTCSDENEWRKRHEERIKNPKPHQVFQSFEHVVEHYKNADFAPFEYEHIIDTTDTIEHSFEEILRIIGR
ncbi:MAG: ATP-binding protein [Oscillospiraceae bacterium]|nr:ATP-binding protein [Oscillospiraceae bacterium]